MKHYVLKVGWQEFGILMYTIFYHRVLSNCAEFIPSYVGYIDPLIKPFIHTFQNWINCIQYTNHNALRQKFHKFAMIDCS